MDMAAHGRLHQGGGSGIANGLACLYRISGADRQILRQAGIPGGISAVMPDHHRISHGIILIGGIDRTVTGCADRRPLFRRQIAAGGPLTVTHKEVTRFFMTIPEAVSLILQACALAEGGEVFVLDMGTPVKIDDMARKMIRLCGLEPDVDIKIEYTGLRPGEKLYEELLLKSEGLEKTENDLIYIGHQKIYSAEEIQAKLAALQEVFGKEPAAVRERVFEMISEDQQK